MGTIIAEVVETGEKRDTRGRRITPPERRRLLVQAYRASGLTMAGFARRERINYATFAGWVAKASREAGARPALRFTEIALPAGTLVDLTVAIGGSEELSRLRSHPTRSSQAYAQVEPPLKDTSADAYEDSPLVRD